MKQLFNIQDTIGKKIIYARFFTDYGGNQTGKDLLRNTPSGSEIALIFEDSFIAITYEHWSRENIDLIVSTEDYTKQVETLLNKLNKRG